jgi:hypothetical protein
MSTAATVPPTRDLEGDDAVATLRSVGLGSLTGLLAAYISLSQSRTPSRIAKPAGATYG